MSGPESLPVFPRCVAPDVGVCVLAPPAKGARVCIAAPAIAVAAVHGVVDSGPAGAPAVVGGSFRGVGEDGVGGDDEAVAL